MIRAAVICNHRSHVQDVLGVDPRNPELLVITPENTEKMRGTKDLYYYAIRPEYARELELITQCGWKTANKVEIRELLGVSK